MLAIEEYERLASEILQNQRFRITVGDSKGKAQLLSRDWTGTAIVLQFKKRK